MGEVDLPHPEGGVVGVQEDVGSLRLIRLLLLLLSKQVSFSGPSVCSHTTRGVVQKTVWDDTMPSRILLR